MSIMHLTKFTAINPTPTTSQNPQTSRKTTASPIFKQENQGFFNKIHNKNSRNVTENTIRMQNLMTNTFSATLYKITFQHTHYQSENDIDLKSNYILQRENIRFYRSLKSVLSNVGH